MAFSLNSSAVKDNVLEDKYGNRGDQANIVQGIPQASFPLEWSDAPEGTRSFALIFMDNDNAKDEGFPFIHWLVADIPADVCKLEENASQEYDQMTQGTNSWSIPFGPYEECKGMVTRRFGGPAPEGCRHEYEMTIYALDEVLKLSEGFYYNDLRKKMRGHVLEKTKLLFNYGENE